MAVESHWKPDVTEGPRPARENGGAFHRNNRYNNIMALKRYYDYEKLQVVQLQEPCLASKRRLSTCLSAHKSLRISRDFSNSIKYAVDTEMTWAT